ncbi:MAG: proline racemase family protein [Candidatus Bipolaricaulota bacterium]|nr:proline racemase family protein [Candidatus Bipolaricaulota bacterium]
MAHTQRIVAIDTHTGGEPTRTILSGLPAIPGDSIAERALYLRRHMDWIRTALVYEPRGNSVMSAVVLTEPCRHDADFGAVFVEVGGYLPMCGHDTIGCCTALVEAGLIRGSGETSVVLDTPGGLVTARVLIDHGGAVRVSFRSVPAFVFTLDTPVDIPGFGRVDVDVAYGGNVYVSVDAKCFGLRLVPSSASDIVRVGIAVREAARRQLLVHHPEFAWVDEITHVQFTAPSDNPDVSGRNAVVIPPGAIDRSACGTGTAARLAILYARGEVDLDEPFVHESLIGTTLTGRLVEETQVGDHAAVVPEISGRAFVTGRHEFVIDSDDPLRDGFLLGSTLVPGASEPGRSVPGQVPPNPARQARGREDD